VSLWVKLSFDERLISKGGRGFYRYGPYDRMFNSIFVSEVEVED
jgi:hypothetical protein